VQISTVINISGVIKQKDDVYQSDPVPGWNRARKTNTWNKGIDDPCPTGYRLPSKEEWSNVLRYNNTNRIGLWRNDGNVRVANAGIIIGDYLMLPAAGKRFQVGATYASGEHNKGSLATIWSSSIPLDIERAYALVIRGTSFYEERSIIKHDALPVRCIKK